MQESWKLLAHLREQQSYCNAAFMTFQNIKLERGFSSGYLIVFQVGVKSFQQVSFPALPRPRVHTRKVGDGGRVVGTTWPLSSTPRATSVNQEPESANACAWWQFGLLCGRPAGVRCPDWGAGAAERSVIWPFLAD